MGNPRRGLYAVVALAAFAVVAMAALAPREEHQASGCLLVERGYGPAGSSPIQVETVVSGLQVPWGLAFLPDGAMLVTERPGRLRLVRGGTLMPSPVAEIEVAAREEGGLAGIALHPSFAKNRLFYLYYSYGAQRVANRVERYRLSADGTRAEADRVIVEDIPGGTNHDGGRIHFGPDGMLYIGTGDARKADLSQRRDTTAGKILRLTPDGEIPADNPYPGNPAFIAGVRNTQGFDWLDGSTLVVTDHGPSGEYGREGHDEVSIARRGDNLGWPGIFGCSSRQDMVTPILAWREAVPPGGAAIYRGTALPGWKGNLVIASLRARHLHRVILDPKEPHRVTAHEVYFKGDPPAGLGRLREVAMGPDGQLYITTSNCDGRGRCPPEGDRVLRVVKK